MIFIFLIFFNGDDPSTLVFPPYLHTLGIRKATRYHLFLFMQNRVNFRDPQGLAVARLDRWEDPLKTSDDDEVTVYGVNSGEHDIIYNTSMSTLGVYGLNEKGERRLKNPRGITANSRGDVYVADTGNHRIVRLFNGGNRLQFVRSIGRQGNAIGTFEGVHDVALSSQGDIYIADTGNHRIQVFDDADNFVSAFGTAGKKDGELDQPTAIVVADRQQPWSYYREEFIIIVDLNHERLQKFSIDGKFIKSVQMKDLGYRTAELMYLSTDFYNHIYVTDQLNHCVHKLDHDLKYLTSFGSKGKGDKEFIEPRGIAIYRRFGQVFIAEKEGAQYYWLGTDATQFSIQPHPKKSGYLLFEYFLTEPSFVRAEVYSESDQLLMKIFEHRFKMSGPNSDLWDGRIQTPQSSMVSRDSTQTYKIKYIFEPTYSSYHYFSKQIIRSF